MPADKLQNSDCPPSQGERELVRYISRAIKRGIIDPEQVNSDHKSDLMLRINGENPFEKPMHY